jgi:hypothetical protein
VPDGAQRRSPMSRRRRQTDESCRCRVESASVEVKRAKFLPEVNVEPLAACSLRMQNCLTYNLGPHPFVLQDTSCLRVEQEGVVAAVPCDVDEAHENIFGCSGRHPTEAVPSNPVPPAGL